jgi:hypothetical protein
MRSPASFLCILFCLGLFRFPSLQLSLSLLCCAIQNARNSRKARRTSGQRMEDASSQCNSFAHRRGCSNADIGTANARVRTSGCWHFCELRTAGAAGIRAANLPRRGVHLDPRLLGLGSRRGRLLLGAGNLGVGAGSWFPVDSGLLGLGRYPSPTLRVAVRKKSGEESHAYPCDTIRGR